MTEFFHNLMYPLPNAVMTVIMGVMLVYWIFVFISGIGMDDLDLGFDFDTDVPEADIDDGIDHSEPDGESGVEKEPGFFIKFLTFMNVGKVPFMLIFSAFKFFIWIGSLMTTSFINVSNWGAWSLLILLPLAFISLFFTKIATNPMAKIFKELGYRGEDEIDFIGRSGKMLSSIKDNKVGTAEVMIDNNPIKLNVVSMDGEELKYGEFVIIEDEAEDKKSYYVSKEISIRNF